MICTEPSTGTQQYCMCVCVCTVHTSGIVLLWSITKFPYMHWAAGFPYYYYVRRCPVLYPYFVEQPPRSLIRPLADTRAIACAHMRAEQTEFEAHGLSSQFGWYLLRSFALHWLVQFIYHTELRHVLGAFVLCMQILQRTETERDIVCKHTHTHSPETVDIFFSAVFFFRCEYECVCVLLLFVAVVVVVRLFGCRDICNNWFTYHIYTKDVVAAAWGGTKRANGRVCGKYTRNHYEPEK